MPQHLRVPLSPSAQQAISHRIGDMACCLRKPVTGSFVAEMDSAPALSIFSFAKEKQKNRG